MSKPTVEAKAVDAEQAGKDCRLTYHRLGQEEIRTAWKGASWWSSGS